MKKLSFLFFLLPFACVLHAQPYGAPGWVFDSSLYDSRFPDMREWAKAGVECGIPDLEVVDTLAPGDNLQEAIDELHRSGGGALLLRKGRYPINSPLYLRDSVVLRGEEKEGVVLENRLRAPFYSSPYGNLATIYFTNVHRAGLENLTVDYTVPDFPPAGFENFAHSWSNTVFKNGPQGDSLLYVSHVVFNGAENAWMKNCHILNAGTDPILVLHSRHIAITHSRVEGAYNKGGGGNGYFNIEKGSEYVLIAHDTVKAIRHLAIQSGARYNVVIDNYFEVDVNFHNGDGGHNLIQNNIVRIPEWHSWHCFTRGVPKHHRPPGDGNLLFNNFSQYKTKIPGVRENLTEYGDSIIYTYKKPIDTLAVGEAERILYEYGPLDREKMKHSNQVCRMNPAWDERAGVLPVVEEAPRAGTFYPVRFVGAGNLPEFCR